MKDKDWMSTIKKALNNNPHYWSLQEIAFSQS